MDSVILQPPKEVRLCIQSLRRCPCGGIGRRSRLKICRSQGREGSIPFVGTKVDKSKNDSVCPFLFWLKP